MVALAALCADTREAENTQNRTIKQKVDEPRITNPPVNWPFRADCDQASILQGRGILHPALILDEALCAFPGYVQSFVKDNAENGGRTLEDSYSGTIENKSRGT